MANKVTFDPINKEVLIKSGNTSIDVKTDIYSAGKLEWKDEVDNLHKYNFFMTAVGGEPIGGGQVSPTYFFLNDGWKIKTPGESIQITIGLNLYTDDQTNPFLTQAGDSVVNEVSNIPGVGSISGLTIDQALKLTEIWELLRGDELINATKYIKYREGTSEVLLDKDVAGGEPLSGPITITKS